MSCPRPFGCPCGYVSDAEPSSSAWHEGHKVAHLAHYPHVDEVTRKSLDLLVEMAKSGELAALEKYS